MPSSKSVASFSITFIIRDTLFPSLGITIYLEKIKAIMEWPTLKNVDEVN